MCWLTRPSGARVRTRRSISVGSFLSGSSSVLRFSSMGTLQEEKDAEYRERRRLNRSGVRQALRKRPNLLERQEKYAQQHSRRLAAQASVSSFPPLPQANGCCSFERPPRLKLNALAFGVIQRVLHFLALFCAVFQISPLASILCYPKTLQTPVFYDQRVKFNMGPTHQTNSL